MVRWHQYRFFWFAFKAHLLDPKIHIHDVDKIQPKQSKLQF